MSHRSFEERSGRPRQRSNDYHKKRSRSYSRSRSRERRVKFTVTDIIHPERQQHFHSDAASTRQPMAAPMPAPTGSRPPPESEGLKEGMTLEKSGALQRDSKVALRMGVPLKYTEVANGCVPRLLWRWHVFKEGSQLKVLHLHRHSWYLLGRDTRVADIPLMHTSVSLQHAVLQFRRVPVAGGHSLERKSAIRPYLMDLGSTNGTFINDEPMEDRRFYQLLEKDCIRFGESSRKYVLLIGHRKQVDALKSASKSVKKQSPASGKLKSEATAVKSAIESAKTEATLSSAKSTCLSAASPSTGDKVSEKAAEDSAETGAYTIWSDED